LINSSLSFLDPRHIGTDLEPFNPAFNTKEGILEKYNKFVNNDPPTTVKMVIEHYPYFAEKFIADEKYKTVFIKPKNYRKRLLKALVEKHLGTYSNGTDRRESREKYVRKLSFSEELIRERFEHYKIHMDYEFACDHVFYDEFIFEYPERVLKILELPFVSPRYKRVAPYYSDYEMLEDIDYFNDEYNRISVEMFNRVI
jgi:hypothetical protein